MGQSNEQTYHQRECTGGEQACEEVFTVADGGLVPRSCPTLAAPRTVARQAPLSTGFPRPEYWSGLPVPSPGSLPDPGIKRGSPASQADS